MTTNLKVNIEAFYKVTYGLYIVSSKVNEKLSGYISNTVFQVTAEPVQFAVCCSKNNFTSEVIKQSKAFSISVLEQDTAAELIGLFGFKSGKDVNKFKGINYITGETGVPIVLDNTIAWFECEVVQTYNVGSHVLFIGKLVNNDLVDIDRAPLTYAYYREVKKGVAPKNAPTYIDKSQINMNISEGKNVKKYKCNVCGYIYDPESGDEKGGIQEGTAFEELPKDWTCPVCDTQKSNFSEI